MDGLYFDDSMEADDEVFRLRDEIEKLAKAKGVEFIKIDFETKEDFYKTMNAFRYFVNDNIRVYSSTNDDEYSLIVNDEEVL